MPRSRMIRPEFWTSEQVLNCSPMARLLFIGLWNFSDDNGVHPVAYKKLKAEVFPTDDYSTKEIQSWVSELLQQGLLNEYTVTDKTYWIVTGWKKHQTIKYPTSLYPEEPINAEQSTNTGDDDSGNIEGAVQKDCSMASPVLTEDCGNPAPQIKINKIKQNKEKHLCESDDSPLRVSSPSSSDASTQLFNYWQRTMNHPRAILDKKRQRAIEQALKQGYTIPELQKAIDGCKKTPFNMGKNDRQQIYDDITLIFRDAEHIERFMGNINKNETQSSPMKSDDIMAGVI
jgi:hypothetical protein